MKYAQVIIDNRASKVDRPFTYKINLFSDIAKEGMRVIVPFGRSNKNIKGFIIKITDDFNEDYELKEIVDVLDDKPLVSKELIELGLWMKDKYLSSYLDSLQPILPPGDYKEINTFVELVNFNEDYINGVEEQKIVGYLKKRGICLLDELKRDLRITNINSHLIKLEENKVISTLLDIKTTISKKYEKYVKINSNINVENALEIIGNRSKKQLEIYKYIVDNNELLLSYLIECLNTSLSTIKAMEKKGVISIFNKEVCRTPIKKKIPHYGKFILNNEQYDVYSKIIESMIKEKNDAFLIHGVTGSGKTEIYLQLVEEMLKQNKD